MRTRQKVALAHHHLLPRTARLLFSRLHASSPAHLSYRRREDHYAVLGVDTTASTDDIRNAYKEKAMKNHPDRGGSQEAWTAIQKAFDTLSDLQRRALYDRTKKDQEGGAEKQFQAKFGEGAFDLSDSGNARPKKGGLNILQQMAEVKKDEERLKASNRTAVIQTGYEMSMAGFEAWLRNQQGLGKTGAFTSDDLLRNSRAFGGDSGMEIEATDSTAQPLPPLTATSVVFDRHGAPDEVLRVDKAHPMPDKLAHGEVLVYMLAACVNDEDLLRVQTPLTILNDFPPFNRTRNKWEEIPLPAVAGVEGVGVIMATAKNLGRPDPAMAQYQNLPGFTQPKEEEIMEVKDWVIALPDARLKPVGCWSTLAICDSKRLLKVPAQLLPTQHYACSRSLCTAYRLLEDYGNLRPGDTIIQNCSDLPVGQAVIQLCNMLKIRTINLVTDDEGFERTKELLMQLGATHVLRDNSKLSEFLDALGSEMPRLALDALGGEAGKRLAIALRPGGTLVMHQMQSGQVPGISPSLLMYQQISMYGFNLAAWTTENGSEAYLQMLRTLAELVAADRLNVFTRPYPSPSSLRTLSSAPSSRIGRCRTPRPSGSAPSSSLATRRLRTTCTSNWRRRSARSRRATTSSTTCPRSTSPALDRSLRRRRLAVAPQRRWPSVRRSGGATRTRCSRSSTSRSTSSSLRRRR